VDDFSARYFRGIHMFIPILSRPRFHDQLVQSGVPSAAFSVLLLCMCMITYHPEFASQSQSIDQATLYLTAKSLLTQVQTSFPPSLHLIQASVIIAAYEYANGKIHNALVSIGSCARMGYTIGLHLASPVDIVDSDTCFEAEKCNTWWGIIICERYTKPPKAKSKSNQKVGLSSASLTISTNPSSQRSHPQNRRLAQSPQDKSHPCRLSIHLYP